MTSTERATEKAGTAAPLDYAGLATARPGRLLPTPLDWFVVLGTIGLLIAVLMPSLNSPRINTTRGGCGANLRSIGQAIQMYANDHDGRYPATLEEVVAGHYAPDVRIFLCPGSGDTPAQGATHAGLTADLMAGGHLSYVYVGGGLTQKSDSSIVIAYEHPTHHQSKGGNVLFADGHVEWHDAADLRAVIDWHARGEGR